MAPSGEQIERFCSLIVQRVKPTSNEVPSYKWMRQGLNALYKLIDFHHDNFQLTKREHARIEANIQRLCQQGYLTKNASREKQWVGVFMICRLTLMLMQDGLVNGTPSWDVTLSKVLAIVLMVALSSRAGDVTKGRHDSQKLPFLCYKDVTLLLHQGSTIDDLIGKFVIRGEKDHKYATCILVLAA